MDIICRDRGRLRTPQLLGEVKIIRSNLKRMETLVFPSSCRAEPFDVPNFTVTPRKTAGQLQRAGTRFWTAPV